MKSRLIARRFVAPRFALIALASFLPTALLAQGLTLSNVQPDRTKADPSKSERVQIRFELSAPAKVSLHLYDGRDVHVRAVESEGVLPAGEHRLVWDLLDRNQRPVPPEAYTYVLEARAKDGKSVRYDLADITGAETVVARDVNWSVKDGQLTYVLDRPSRVNVRLGLKDGGPLLRTLLDWVVRPGGLQREVWDGKDASGVLDLGNHPNLTIGVQAFSLPQNTIIVGPPQTQIRLIEQPATAKLTRREKEQGAAAPKRMYSHAQQPLEARGDFSVQLTLPQSLPRTPAGVAIVSTTIPVRLEVAAQDRERALSRRFEPVFFVDGQFAFENEVGFVPMTWNFDPAALNEGEHFLTVNLRGYEGNFGMATVKIIIKRAAAAANVSR